MASRIFNPHENSDFSGNGSSPVGNNEYTQPLVGQGTHVHSGLSAPTVYTHPKTSVPGMIAKGKVHPDVRKPVKKSIGVSSHPEQLAPYGSTT